MVAAARCFADPAASVALAASAALADHTAVAAASLAADMFAALLAVYPVEHQLEMVAPAEFVEHTAAAVEQSFRGKQSLAAVASLVADTAVTSLHAADAASFPALLDSAVPDLM